MQTVEKTTSSLNSTNAVFNEDIIREHWDRCEKGFYDKAKKWIDNNGWMHTQFFKLNEKGKSLMDEKDGSTFRPKSLNGLI